MSYAWPSDKWPQSIWEKLRPFMTTIESLSNCKIMISRNMEFWLMLWDPSIQQYDFNQSERVLRFVLDSLCVCLCVWDWSSNSGLCTWQSRCSQFGCSQSRLPLEPHLQPILLWLFWTWDLTNYLLRLISNHDPLDLSLPSS
jgi:hypothetical protein